MRFKALMDFFKGFEKGLYSKQRVLEAQELDIFDKNLTLNAGFLELLVRFG